MVIGWVVSRPAGPLLRFIVPIEFRGKSPGTCFGRGPKMGITISREDDDLVDMIDHSCGAVYWKEIQTILLNYDK